MAALIKVNDRQVRIDGRALRIARLDAEKYHFLSDPTSIVSGLQDLPERVDIFTFIQRIKDPGIKYPFPFEIDNFAAVPISTYDHWWSEQIGFKARNKAKQAAKKGVETREVPFNDELALGIWEIYNECPIRQGKPFKHYGKDFETVYRETATYLESSVFVGAFLDKKLIGFIKLVRDEESTQAGLMNIVSMIQHRDKAPSNALVAHAVRSCADRGIAHLVYSNFAYGNKQADSLSDFKERNGFLKIDVLRYYAPISIIGSLALRLGFHRRLSERLPENIMARARKVRNSWYKRKYASLMGTS
jgi:hypothetical protein